MDDLDFMCAIAVQAMDDCCIEGHDVRGARAAAYDALLDFDVEDWRKEIAVDTAVDEYFVGLF